MEINVQEQKPYIKLNKGITGGYGWEIKFYGDSTDEIVENLKAADNKLKEEFSHPKDKDKDKV